MNKERYKYTPNIDQIATLGPLSTFDMTIDARDEIYLATPKGYNVTIPHGGQCEGIVAINLTYPQCSHCEVVNTITLDTGASLRLSIFHHSTAESKIKSSLNIIMGADATLELVELVDTRSTVLSSIDVKQKRNSQVKITTLDLNNKSVVRNQYIELSGEHASCLINGLYLTSSEEHVDNYIKMHHAAPNCQSNQRYKGILMDNSTAAFTGHILVKKDSQKTAAHQHNNNVLLSDTARVYSRPQLEIYADDVKCNHGSTVGMLDSAAIDYMRQRGIPIEEARRLQLTGFAQDVVELDDFEDLKAIVHQKISRKLSTK